MYPRGCGYPRLRVNRALSSSPLSFTFIFCLSFPGLYHPSSTGSFINIPALGHTIIMGLHRYLVIIGQSLKLHRTRLPDRGLKRLPQSNFPATHSGQYSPRQRSARLYSSATSYRLQGCPKMNHGVPHAEPLGGP